MQTYEIHQVFLSSSTHRNQYPSDGRINASLKRLRFVSSNLLFGVLEFVIRRYSLGFFPAKKTTSFRSHMLQMYSSISYSHHWHSGHQTAGFITTRQKHLKQVISCHSSCKQAPGDAILLPPNYVNICHQPDLSSGPQLLSLVRQQRWWLLLLLFFLPSSFSASSPPRLLLHDFYAIPSALISVFTHKKGYIINDIRKTQKRPTHPIWSRTATLHLPASIEKTHPAKS